MSGEHGLAELSAMLDEISCWQEGQPPIFQDPAPAAKILLDARPMLLHLEVVLGNLTTVGSQLDDALVMNAERFTCDEAAALYDLIEVVWGQRTADWFMVAHAQGDTEDGDQHEPITTEPGWRLR